MHKNVPSKRVVNEVSYSIKQNIDNLTSLISQLMVGNQVAIKKCGIPSMQGHPTNACPTLCEEEYEQVGAIGGFSNQQQRWYDTLGNTYNPN